MTIERRSHPHGGSLRVSSSASGGRVIRGYAAVFDIETTIGSFREVVRPGAFTRTLANPFLDAKALFNHDQNLVLGRTLSGTLRLHEDSQGLAFEVDVPATHIGDDLLVLLRRGDISQCSFAFSVAPGGERWNRSLRELLDLDLWDASVVTSPAYPATSVSLKAKATNAERLEALERKTRIWKVLDWSREVAA